MPLAQSQYLRLFDAAGTTYARWQSYYIDTAVSWQGASWQFQQFAADGLTDGTADDGDSITIQAPATNVIIEAFQNALAAGWLAELLIYQFDPLINNSTPQGGQTLIGGYVGQAVAAKATMTSFALVLGSALAPVGAQVPPRKLTTLLMGQGCRL